MDDDGHKSIELRTPVIFFGDHRHPLDQTLVDRLNDILFVPQCKHLGFDVMTDTYPNQRLTMNDEIIRALTEKSDIKNQWIE